METLLRKHLSLVLCRPSSQAISLASHVDNTIVHLDDDGRNRCLFRHLDLVDSTAATGPVVLELVLLLPICSASSSY